MNILQVSHSFYPCYKAGGVVKVIYEISRSLVKRGHHVTVITTDGCIPRLAVETNIEIDVDGIRVWYFRNISNFLRVKFKIATPYFLPLFIINNIKKFDIIHIHEHRTFIAIIVCYYARKYNIPYIIQSHGSVLPFFEKQFLKQAFDVMWGNKILQNASKCIALTKTELDQYIRMGVPEDKITIVPNGINDVSSIDHPPAGQFREQYGIHEKHIILYVGRIHKRKGIDFLIHAFKSFILTWTDDDVALVIVGPDDGYRSVLEDLVEQLGLSKKVRFIGYVPSLTAAYQDADVLVYPSIHEIFGLVPFEALLHGTPVIVTDDCGCGELISEAGCGYLVHYGDVAGLSETVRYALEHPEKNENKVQAGKKFIREQLAWERIVKQVEKIYQDIISS